MQHRRLHTGKIANGPHTGIQIERLSYRYVQRSNSAANWCRERSLDRNHVALKGVQGFFRQILVFAIDLGCFLSRVNLHPLDFAFIAIRLLDGRIDDVQHHGRNIDTNTIAFDERNDREVRDVQAMVGIYGNGRAVGGHIDMIVVHVGSGGSGKACIVQAAGEHKKC